jgi:hypothetical protein
MKKKLNNITAILDSFAKKGKWQSVIVKYITSDLFWLLVCCGTFRLVFYLSYNIGDGSGDSETYWNYSANIFQGQVDILRTPVYPYFIKMIKLFGNNSLIQNIIAVQAIISFLVIIIFYKIACFVFRNRAVILIATLIYGIMPSIINFDKCILTESLSIDATVVFMYFIISYLKRPAIWKAILFTLYIFLTIMLRPSFVILLPVMILFWILRILFIKAEWKNCLSGIAASIVCVMLIFGYSRLNFVNNGYNGISVVSNINQLDVIINANMYLDGNDSEITESIKSNLTEPHGPYNSMYNILIDKFSHDRIAQYLRSCVKNQPGVYIKDALKKMVTLSKSTTRAVYVSTKGGLSGRLLSPLSHFLSINFLIIYVLIFFDFIYIVVRMIRTRQVHWFRIILLLIIATQLVTIIIGAQGEYKRLFVIVLPCVIILLFSYADMLVSSFNKKESANAL